MDHLTRVKAVEKELVQDLSQWIKQGSVYDETTVSKTAPFGQGVANALTWIAKKAKADGFDVEECQGYCVEITMGQGKELVMVLGHADVVPTGNHWKEDPFSGSVKNGVVYGRGTQDDKGPTMAAYYAMKLIKDSKIPLKRRIRLVVGGNEERGSSCLHYYFNTLKKESPTYGFTPDAAFPLIYGEKGILNFAYEGSLQDPVIRNFEAGIASNSVPEIAKAEVIANATLKSAFEAYLKQHQLNGEVKAIDKGFQLIVHGKAAHGSRPSDGVNAATHLLRFLGQQTASPLAKHFGPLLHDYSGKDLGIAQQSTTMGELTVNVGIMKFANQNYQFVLNIRYPNDLNSQTLISTLTKKALHEGKKLSDSAPLYVNPKSPLIQTLMKSYQTITGDKTSQPFTIGGGTYARSTVNTVAFGMAFPNRSVDLMHQRDEQIPIEELTLGAAIYLHALEALAK